MYEIWDTEEAQEFSYAPQAFHYLRELGVQEEAAFSVLAEATKRRRSGNIQPVELNIPARVETYRYSFPVRTVHLRRI